MIPWFSKNNLESPQTVVDFHKYVTITTNSLDKGFAQFKLSSFTVSIILQMKRKQPLQKFRYRSQNNSF